MWKKGISVTLTFVGIYIVSFPLLKSTFIQYLVQEDYMVTHHSYYSTDLRVTQPCNN